ncbi:hypothetical protein RclHR1_13140002 [Rhizophagus clarus]|uniref:Uncharacterized protein n=1 Tax=Rhizophagus clarus TaxID=94130 RepID=A0A2Z6QDV9_9GLOM|nr:hypothetical protein RclHR1_13140002 [Rhizophagus clarus]
MFSPALIILSFKITHKSPGAVIPLLTSKIYVDLLELAMQTSPQEHLMGVTLIFQVLILTTIKMIKIKLLNLVTLPRRSINQETTNLRSQILATKAEAFAGNNQQISHKKQKFNENSEQSQSKITDFHESSKLSQESYHEITRAYVKIFVICGIPWHVIENPFFIELLKILRLGYMPPSKDTLSDELFA